MTSSIKNKKAALPTQYKGILLSYTKAKNKKQTVYYSIFH